MQSLNPVLPHPLILNQLLEAWLLEDIGRGDRTTDGLFSSGSVPTGHACWMAKEAGIIAGLPIAARIFQILQSDIEFTSVISDGEWCEAGQIIAQIQGPMDVLLLGERVALNLAMRLSGIATMTSRYVELIADLPAQLVDTRKTTPGLRLLEKYAVRVGGGVNHRLGLDDSVMIKDNHIVAAGGIKQAIAQIRPRIPYPLSIEVETESLDQVNEALDSNVDIIMLDNMPLDLMSQAVGMIRQRSSQIKIEASGNITLDTIRAVAETGVDYISSSAPVTRSTWLDLSMKLL